MVRARFGVVVLLAAIVLPAQNPTVVSGGGGAFNLAVRAASPGDRLLVRAGDYDALLIDRGLDVVCDPGVRFAAGFLGGGSPSRVTGVPAGQRLVIEGGAFHSSSFRADVEIAGCGGEVLWLRPVFEAPSAAGGLMVRSCADVHLQSPTFQLTGMQILWSLRTESSVFRLSHASPAPGLGIVASRVTLTDVNLPEILGQSGMVAQSSWVTVVDSHFRGSTQHTGLASLAGIQLSSSELTLGGASSSTAGTGFLGLNGAIDVVGGSSLVRVGPDVLLVARGNPIQGPAVVRREPVAVLDVPPELSAGQPFDLGVRSAPRDLVFVLVALPGPVGWTPFGPIWVDPQALVLAAIAVPSNGLVTATFVAPRLLQSVRLVLQPIRLGATGAVGLGASTAAWLH